MKKPFFLLLVCLCSLSYAQGNKRPNILFCLADDWGWPHASAYGDRFVNTPFVDKLAQGGVLFERAFVTSPSCTPSRNAILTGQDFYRLGEGANLWSTLDVREPNFMYMLRDAGYAIGHSDKAWGPGDYKVAGYEEHPCGPRTNLRKLLKERDTGQPFAYWMGTHDPHRPYNSVVKGYGVELSGEKLVDYKYMPNRPYDAPLYVSSGVHLDKIEVPGFLPDKPEVRQDIADYYYEVERWDRDIGAVLSILEEAGELENTIVVVTGDHGMPFPRAKGNLYDYGVRVPLVIYWKGQILTGKEVMDFVHLHDLAPTFLDAAGIEIPKIMTGRSLLPTLKGEDSPVAERTFAVFGRERHTPAQLAPSLNGYPMRGIRTKDWLLILNLKPERLPMGVRAGGTYDPNKSYVDAGGGPTHELIVDNPEQFAFFFQRIFEKRPSVELYDCRNDPFQLYNLAQETEYKKVVEELRSQLIGYLKKTGDPRFSSSDAELNFDEYPYRGRYHGVERVQYPYDGSYFEFMKMQLQ